MNALYYRHNKSSQSPKAILRNVIDFNELTIVLKGELIYEVNGQTYVIKKGDYIYIKSNSIRSRKEGTQADYVSFNFYKDIENLPTHVSDCITNEIKLMLGVCDEIYSKYNDWFDKIDKALDLIITLLKNKVVSLEENPIILSIKRYIRNNLSTKLTLSKISNHVGYSPNYCDALFKKETGISVVSYLIEERIAEAKRLIDEKILSLKDIAESVGFDDYNYFSRTFKKVSGATPTEYKTLNTHI